MDENNISSFQNIILTCQNLEKNEAVPYQNYLVNMVCGSHPLSVLIENESWTTPCLVISKQIEATEDITHTPTKNYEGNDFFINESFAGSPLKLQEFQVDKFIIGPTHTDTEKKEIIRPLDINEARTLVSLYNLCGIKHSEKTDNNNDKDSMMKSHALVPPMLVMCNGNDEEHNVIIGSRLCQSDNCNAKFMVTSVTVHGNITKNADVIRKLWVKRPPFCRNGKNLVTQCFATYSLLGTETPLSSTADNLQRILEVHYHWSKFNTLLQEPPADAKMSIKATVVVGDHQSAAYHIFQELCVLKRLVAGIQSRSVEWSPSQDDRSLLSRVKNLIKDAEAGMAYVEPKDVDGNANETSFSAQNLLISQREELDFTEHIWLILKDCSRLQDLTDCYNYFVSMLKSGDLQLVVHQNNKTRLGQMIRDSYYSRMIETELEGTELLELLAEIGFEKMSNDYTHIFHELVTMDSLDKFIRPKRTLVEKLDGLEKLHRVLELIVMLETLNLPKVILRIAARQALKHYETNPATPSHTFTIPVQSTSIKGVDDNQVFSNYKLKLTTWQAHLTAIKNETTVRAVYMFTETVLFDHLNKSNYGCSNDGDHKQYHMTCLTEDVVVL